MVERPKPAPSGKDGRFVRDSSHNCQIRAISLVLALTRMAEAGVDRLGADLEPGLERAHQMLADLQRGLQLGGQQRGRLVGQHIGQNERNARI